MGTARSLPQAARCRQPYQPASNVQFIVPNSTSISTYGRQHLEVSIGEHTFGRVFIVADVTLPLVGADLLAHYQLLVDVARCQVVDISSLTTIPNAAAPTEFALQVVEVTESFTHFRNAYPDVFKPELRQQPQTPAKHGIYHRIKTSRPRCSPSFVTWLRTSSSQQNRPSPSSRVWVSARRRQGPGLHHSTSCFGLRNSGGATFQRMMDGIQGDLLFCACYIDDFLISSSSKEEHLHHLSEALGRLQQNGLVIRYDKFLPGIAATMTPLYEILAGKPKDFMCPPPQAEAFQRAKNVLAAETLLAFPIPGKPLIVTTDASNIAIATVLRQVIHEQLRPMSFFSRKLLKAKKNHSTFDKELLAVHQAFTPLPDKQTPVPHDNAANSAIAEFNCTFRHLPGKKNPVANALSRVEIDAVQVEFDYGYLAKEQQRDPETLPKSKVYRHTVMGPGPFHQPQRRFAHIYVDVVGPLPPSAGHHYLFTIIDRSTRWPEAILIPDATSTSCTTSLLSE
ncbi:uncharacterized protein LOC143039263 [Oratosquilla oratoria]|uniref:uncharacterized protein LOC143039263 n=1 Tax=Oratosquilla oratoria TaxID=337810 RepID=UPI003F7702AA